MRAVAKGNRNRQQARAKVAQMRAQEARRRRRRLWLAVSAAVVVVAAAAVGIALAVSGGSGSSGSPALKLASLSTLGPLRAAPSPGSPGPENGIPVPSAAPLATAAASASGQTVDGISCQSSEQTIFHIHAHLTIFVNGAPRQVPAAIGIPGAQAQSTAQGPYIGNVPCFYWLHTHAP